MPRLTNPAFADIARQYKQHKADEHDAKEKADVLKDQLLAELARRKVDSEQVDGMIVTRKAKRTRVYKIDELKKVLGRTRAAKVLATVVVVRKLDELVKQGDVGKADVEACLERTDESAPYVDVTLVKP